MLTTRSVLAILLCAVSLAALAACGKTAPGATNFDPATGKHSPADWSTNHGATYILYKQQCQQCHGADLRGGTSQVSCFTTSCHAIGPHAKMNTFKHYTTLNFTTLCTPCHGAAFQGGKAAPACGKCHTNLAISSDGSSPVPPVRGQCTSCHTRVDSTGKLTGPSGAIYPNRSGAHPRHLGAYPGSDRVKNITCDLCHLNGGSETANHGSRLTVAFPTEISVRGQIATYDQVSKRCNNVSCHGGILTPRWGIDRLQTDSSGCTSCHRNGAGDPLAPYNSYSSGRKSLNYENRRSHAIHVEVARMLCIDCHNVSALYTTPDAAHFWNLTTGRLELQPRNTLRSDLNYQGDFNTCTPSGSYSFTPCHGGRTWR